MLYHNSCKCPNRVSINCNYLIGHNYITDITLTQRARIIMSVLIMSVAWSSIGLVPNSRICISDWYFWDGNPQGNSRKAQNFDKIWIPCSIGLSNRNQIVPAGPELTFDWWYSVSPQEILLMLSHWSEVNSGPPGRSKFVQIKGKLVYLIKSDMFRISRLHSNFMMAKLPELLEWLLHCHNWFVLHSVHWVRIQNMCNES